MISINKELLLEFINIHIRKIIILLVVLLHIILLLTINLDRGKRQRRKNNKIFKMTDITEFIPPAIDEDKIMISKQDNIAEHIIETDKEIEELDINYLPQYLISEMPIMPIEQIRSKKVYPPLASKQGIEGIVYLELFIDQMGMVRQVTILKDPGYGFGEAAVKALHGLRCVPAKANGIPVAARIRFPVRFSLKK